MTHEHMDHIQGLPYAASKFGIELDINYAWLTASAAEDYYETHENAKKKRLAARQLYDVVDYFLNAAPSPLTARLRAIWLNNNPRSSDDNVAYLRKRAKIRTSYIHVKHDLNGTHPFEEVKFQVLAPQEDTSDYYGRFNPSALNFSFRDRLDVSQIGEPPRPPAGVDAGVFYDLVASRRQYHLENLLSIDKAANNSSIVLFMEWRGWKLLFPGDAEERSWKIMQRDDLLQPVHFLKVSHHGSYNGTPDLETLEKILPLNPTDDRPRRAIMSTCENVYNGIPARSQLNAKLGQRCELKSTEDIEPGKFIDYEFEG
jgi:hypothetical protein